MRDHQMTDEPIELGAASELTHGDERLDFTEAVFIPDHWDKP